MKNKWLKSGLASAVLLAALAAVAGPDTFFLGSGAVTGTVLTVPAPGAGQPTVVQVNTYAQVTAISATTVTPIGLPQLATGSKQRGVVATSVDADDFAANKLVMVIQTTGFTPTTAPPAGTEQEVLDLSNSQVGRWELAKIRTYDGQTGTMVLTEPLKYTYSDNSTQVVTVPEYQSVAVADGAKIEPLPWDGQVGGVVAFLVSGTINLNTSGSISAAGKGARGGAYSDENGATTTGCMTTGDVNTNDPKYGTKGEGLSTARYSATSRGLPNFTSGGGGGICANSGGGGGGNSGLGGVGGNTTEATPREVGGLGGAPLSYSPLDHLTFGGGGGSGQGTANNNTPNGGRGGGIIFFRANQLSGGTVTASGQSAALSDESGGGGGAGGSISIRLADLCSTTNIVANGGNGGSVNVEQTASVTAPGPGGGGGGGRVLLQAKASDCSLSVAAGTAGRTKPPTNGTGLERGAKPTASVANLPPYVGTVTFLAGALAQIPQPTIAPALPSLTNAPTLTVGGTGTRNAALLAYRQVPNTADAKVAQGVIDSSGSFSLGVPLLEGDNTLKFAVEFKGLQGPSTTTSTVKLDTRPPDTTASTALALPTSAASISFTVAASEADLSPCPTCPLTCQLTLPNQSAPGYGACQASYNLTSVGAYKFEARARDLAQNEDPTPAVINFTVDRTGPDVTIKATDPVPPFLFTRATTASFGFSSTAPDFLRFECRLDWRPAGGGATTNGSWDPCPATHFLSGLQDNRRYTLSVRAVDQALNVSNPVADHSWTVDTVSPDTSLPLKPPPETQTNDPFNFSGDDPSIGASNYECSLDGAAFVGCGTPHTPTLTVVEGERKQHTL
ncbi:adventurous gliding motility protein AgmC, partial [Pyxidicoccus caerfyrddinensis]|uniref:adventurous gliding motility protein AgmC n=1 Tax=Pyxidicoccus caerfyrddinensis TaxID=2709663 RepID=UPI003B83A294